ncbi:uncharacterized protein LOC111306406 [Durio zibethinus]|uniref:Uncharacterized protein LOC111306406 n=1 Tax=Durio zibethinus TaxID=66656 RepID=A0A6P6A4V5_DURZI|nr:uncharacterized protein LOC111306406 [Durio zibethinus]
MLLENATPKHHEALYGCHLDPLITCPHKILSQSISFLRHLVLFFILFSSVSLANRSNKETRDRQPKKKKKEQRCSTTTAPRSYLALYAAQKEGLFRRIASGAAIKGRTADPTIHSGELEAGPDVHRGEPQGIENSLDDNKFNEFRTEAEPKPGYETESLMQPKMPHDSSLRLKSSQVNHPLEPIVQQSRTVSTAVLETVCFAGLDGTPWPESKEKEQSDMKEKAMDNKEYYGHHKASPLSEIKVADTRKPITRATDGTVTEVVQNEKDGIGWRPEELDTAEEALSRATKIWKENAMRGIPEAPHSRILRELHGEWF